MSFNEFMLPAFPQTPAGGLKGAPKADSGTFRSLRADEANEKGQSFLATLNQISNQANDRSRESTRADHTSGVSDYSDSAAKIPGEMNPTDDRPSGGVEDAEMSEFDQPGGCLYPLRAFGMIQQQFFNFMMSSEDSFSGTDHPDSTAESTQSLWAHLIASFQPEGQTVQNGQVGIGLFEQLQASVSPESANFYFFEQLVSGAFHQQDSSDTAGNWGYGTWMANLPAADLSAQADAFGPQVKPMLLHLLSMLGADSARSESATLGDGTGEPKSAAHPTALDLNAEFLLKMSTPSQPGKTDIPENIQTAVAAGNQNGNEPLPAAGIQDSATTAETLFQLEKNHSQTHQLPETAKPSEQTTDAKFAAQVAVAKPAEEGFHPKGGVLKNQMPAPAQTVDNFIQLEGENKDSSLLSGQDQMSERLMKFENPAPTPESAQRSLSSQAMNQIVQRAVLSFSNGQNEVRIDLKPEFLGHIRMQIVSDSHQVAVKILAESPFVKDMLESNLNQLKADLQTQGLKVDDLEVSVAHDSHSDFKDQTSAGASQSSGSRQDPASEISQTEAQIESQGDNSDTLAESAIDFFA